MKRHAGLEDQMLSVGVKDETGRFVAVLRTTATVTPLPGRKRRPRIEAGFQATGVGTSQTCGSEASVGASPNPARGPCQPHESTR
jgi:hypothetical protein